MASTYPSTRGVERRRHWRDRRSGLDRRSSARNQHESFDCRSGVPRRRSDIAGDTCDGEIWWRRSPAPWM